MYNNEKGSSYQESNPRGFLNFDNSLKDKFLERKNNNNNKRYRFRFFISLIISFFLLFIGIYINSNKAIIINRLNIQVKELENEIKYKDYEINRLKEENINEKIEMNSYLSQLVKMQKFSLLKQYGEIDFDNIIIEDLKFTFKFKGGKNIILNEDCVLASNGEEKKRQNGQGRNYIGSVIGDRLLIKNKVNRWKIKINSLGDGIMIGVSLSNIDINGKNNYRKSWCISSKSSFVYSGGKMNSYGGNKDLKQGDIIEIIADLIKGNLGFKVNDINLGIACNDILKHKDLVPFIEMSEYGKNEVILLDY